MPESAKGFQKIIVKTSLVVKWLKLPIPNMEGLGGLGSIRVGELRSCMPHGMA